MPITNDVTLILGAGASIPYGFPNGRHLVAQALDLDELHLTRDYALDLGSVRRFKDGLERSRMSSIDAFLETRSKEDDLVATGKAIIARLLIPHEHRANLRLQLNPNGQWYDYLWKLLHAVQREDWADNRL